MSLMYQFVPKPAYRLLQLSDCHLLAEPTAEYQQIQPYQHLKKLLDFHPATDFDAVILTGDLTQDHSLASYQLLAALLGDWQQHKPVPVFYLPGNHDDPGMMAEAFVAAPFQPAQWLSLNGWLLGLLNTKGPTPAGEFDLKRRTALAQQLNETDTPVWLFCHHQPAPIGSFIDTLGLTDADAFWQLLALYPQVQGLAHGHCHYGYARALAMTDLSGQGDAANAINISPTSATASFRQLQIVGCPATSVQFKQTADWQTEDLGPKACVWTFSTDNNSKNSTVSWEFIGLLCKS